uniref:Sporozoite surface protein p67 n=5 Tax=Theileria parva TaxID=5875 RepID=Q94814_THEPA|nr:sporozoite surface protein p67 [Theileria parva]
MQITQFLLIIPVFFVSAGDKMPTEEQPFPSRLSPLVTLESAITQPTPVYTMRSVGNVAKAAKVWKSAVSSPDVSTTIPTPVSEENITSTIHTQTKEVPAASGSDSSTVTNLVQTQSQVQDNVKQQQDTKGNKTDSEEENEDSTVSTDVSPTIPTPVSEEIITPTLQAQTKEEVPPADLSDQVPSNGSDSEEEDNKSTSSKDEKELKKTLQPGKTSTGETTSGQDLNSKQQQTGVSDLASGSHSSGLTVPGVGVPGAVSPQGGQSLASNTSREGQTQHQQARDGDGRVIEPKIGLPGSTSAPVPTRPPGSSTDTRPASSGPSAPGGPGSSSRSGGTRSTDSVTRPVPSPGAPGIIIRELGNRAMDIVQFLGRFKPEPRTYEGDRTNVAELKKFLFEELESLVNTLIELKLAIANDFVEITDGLRKNTKDHEARLKLLKGVEFTKRKSVANVVKGFSSLYCVLLMNMNGIKEKKRESEVADGIWKLSTLPDKVANELLLAMEKIVVPPKTPELEEAFKAIEFGFKIAYYATKDILSSIENTVHNLMHAKNYEENFIAQVRNSLRMVPHQMNLTESSFVIKISDMMRRRGTASQDQPAGAGSAVTPGRGSSGTGRAAGTGGGSLRGLDLSEEEVKKILDEIVKDPSDGELGLGDLSDPSGRSSGRQPSLGPSLGITDGEAGPTIVSPTGPTIAAGGEQPPSAPNGTAKGPAGTQPEGGEKKEGLIQKLKKKFLGSGFEVASLMIPMATIIISIVH